ncbi:MAG: hypothetical protein EOP04_14945 [Proteobacteria bacterium]|nr:MAG: hypothetical protein EOP04_14945 [Pseudomonadota bacterium]
MNFTRSKFGKVYVQAYCPIAQRGKFLPRSETRHLDNLSDEEIWAFIREKQAATISYDWGHTSPSEAVESVLPASVTINFERWLAHLEERGLDMQTIRQHRSLGGRFVLEYFGKVGKEPDPNRWPEHTGNFYRWLTSAASLRLKLDGNGEIKRDVNGAKLMEPAACSNHQIKLVNICLRKFFRWMVEENLVNSVELRLRPPPSSAKKVQLQSKLSPDQVLAWARECENRTVKFLGLAGYFFSLRPQEVCALRPIDFRTDHAIKGLECVTVMKRAGLYGGLVTYVGRQKQTLGTIKDNAKKGSNGWVSCFSKEAAQEIVNILNEEKLSEEVAKWNITKLYEDWRMFGPKGFTMKDMRRASLHWLGQNSQLQPLHLMKHARHRNIETTMVYCQRPEEKLKEIDLATFSLNLEDN